MDRWRLDGKKLAPLQMTDLTNTFRRALGGAYSPVLDSSISQAVKT